MFFGVLQAMRLFCERSAVHILCDGHLRAEEDVMFRGNGSSNESDALSSAKFSTHISAEQ